MKKDAKYYLSRTNDLPYFMVDNLKELKQQINQTRYIYTTPRDLIQRLELETDLVDFSNNTSSVYLDLNTLLETYGMKLVPGFIPCDIKFDDRIQVTIKPNLNNDEDFSYVQELIKSKRVPTQKDASYIARMSTKIANYNIMLRVFESLHVISKTIDSHLRLELDNILNSLSLPKEGYNYLKTCYSFACLNLNYKCDYQNQNLCFKQLDNKNHLRFISIMAKLAIYNGENFSVDREFPYYDTLLLEIAHQKNLIKEKEKQSKIQAFKDKEFKEHLRARVEAIAKLDEIDKKKSSTGIIISKQQTLGFFEKPVKEEVLLEKSVTKGNYYQKKTVEQKIRKKEYSFFENNSFFPLSSISEKFNFVSKFRYLNTYSMASLKPYLTLATTQKEDSHNNNLSFSDVVSKKSEFTNSSFLNNYFFNILNNSKLPVELINTINDLCNSIDIRKTKDSETAILSDNVISSNLDYLHDVLTCVIPDSEKIHYTTNRRALGLTGDTIESRLYAILYFYLVVILKQLINPSGKAELSEYRNELDRIYEKTEDTTLLLIKLLDFLLFKLPYALNDENVSIENLIVQDDDLLLGFYAYPQCIETAINIILAKRKIEMITDSDISSLFSLMLILLEKENSNSRSNLIRVPNRSYLFRIRLFVKIIKDNLYRYEKLCSFESLNCSDRNIDEKIFSSFNGINVSYQDSLAAYLANHETFRYLISPLLSHTTLEKISCSRLCFNLKDCIDLTKNILNQNKSLTNAIMNAKSPDLTLRLLSNTLMMKEQLNLIGKLNNLSFDNLNTVINLIDPKCNHALASCIEKGILNLGLMAVPIEHALSAKERCNLKHHKIIQTEIDNTLSKVLTDEFYEKLACAQNALIIYSYVVVQNNAEKTLVRILKLENQEQEKLAMKFFICLKQLVRGNPRYTNAYYARLARAKEISPTVLTTINYLNELIKEEMRIHPLASYFTNIFKETLKPLLSDISENKTSFADKKKNLTVADFDESKISSKLTESNHIQNVIEAIRITEGSLKDDEFFEPDFKGSDNTDENKDQNNPSVAKLPSSSARSLVDSLVKSGCDVMDLDEFNGLCLSAKYMSKDVAIEEINDFCYEEFDEPLLDVDYEGNTVYITLDILNQMKE